MFKIYIKGILNQRIIIKGNVDKKSKLTVKLDDKVYFENEYKKCEEIKITKDLISYNKLTVYVNDKLYKEYNQKKSNRILKKIYKVLGLSKLEKIFMLLKKSIYFAWHRHHFLMQPKAMK